DASGFQFGDQWGPIICCKAAVRFQNAKRMGKKIILLPQAFGPFESTSTRQSMKAILRCSDLVYARDETSLQYLSDLDTNQSAIRLAPDFTNLLPAQTTYINSDKAAGACLLPNQRMLDKAPAETSSRYIGFLAATARTLNDRGLSPFFLIHEIATDRAVVERVNQQLDVPLPIVEESDVFQIKHILGNSRTVIGSRYHGLVSALSQGVPCVATGWSHKYFHLMKDYDCQDYFVDLSGSQPERQLSGLLDPGYLQNCRRRVANRAQELRLQAEAMWREVFEVLGVA
ncbi:MAG: polysaccharide pyruvyl transferase family protein, partial [Planctomycetales bacterium]